jgi:hypothetical protein
MMEYVNGILTALMIAAAVIAVRAKRHADRTEQLVHMDPPDDGEDPLCGASLRNRMRIQTGVSASPTRLAALVSSPNAWQVTCPRCRMLLRRAQPRRVEQLARLRWDLLSSGFALVLSVALNALALRDLQPRIYLLISGLCTGLLLALHLAYWRRRMNVLRRANREQVLASQRADREGLRGSR